MASKISGMLIIDRRVQIIPVFRSANQVVDHMAKIGATQVEAEHLWILFRMQFVTFCVLMGPYSGLCFVGFLFSFVHENKKTKR